MLSHIHIRDFTIVDRLELELGAGMTALTGETGAGKSILIDALGLALGDRADSGTVRHGSHRAEIDVSFDLRDNTEARHWLRENDLDEGDECHLRRIVTAEGRSRGYINGRPVNMQSLRELGEMLVDIHGQHEHQSLLKRDMQRQLVDAYGGHGDLLSQLADIYHDWHESARRLADLRSDTRERGERMDLLRFQIGELEGLGLGAGELRELEAEHHRLANAGRLLSTCEAALARLYEMEDGAVYSTLSNTARDLADLAPLDAALDNARQLVEGALIQVQEAADELRQYRDSLDLDPARLQWVEQRLGDIHDLARKHRVDPTELPELLDSMRAELAGLDQADERADELERQVDELAASYRSLAQRLGAARQRAAERLSAGVSEVMDGLGMPGGRFSVVLETPDPERFTAHGLERIEFLVSTNPGQPLKPLTKVASGGELARISLAIQVIAARQGRIPTLIFDEVDTGIGGGVAEIVGQRLRALGEDRQVLCVTHLPQVAAQAHHHLFVRKRTDGETTRTDIQALDTDDRIEEVARMLGGVEITAQTRAHAEEMIGKAGG